MPRKPSFDAAPSNPELPGRGAVEQRAIDILAEERAQLPPKPPVDLVAKEAKRVRDEERAKRRARQQREELARGERPIDIVSRELRSENRALPPVRPTARERASAEPVVGEQEPMTHSGERGVTRNEQVDLGTVNLSPEAYADVAPQVEVVAPEGHWTDRAPKGSQVAPEWQRQGTAPVRVRIPKAKSQHEAVGKYVDRTPMAVDEDLDPIDDIVPPAADIASFAGEDAPTEEIVRQEAPRDDVGSSINDELEVIDLMEHAPRAPMTPAQFENYLAEHATFTKGEVVTRPGKNDMEAWTVQKVENGKVYLGRGKKQAVLDGGQLVLEQMAVREIDGVDKHWNDVYSKVEGVLPAGFGAHRSEAVLEAAESLVRARATGQEADPAHALFTAMREMQSDLMPVAEHAGEKRAKSELAKESPERREAMLRKLSPRARRAFRAAYAKAGIETPHDTDAVPPTFEAPKAAVKAERPKHENEDVLRGKLEMTDMNIMAAESELANLTGDEREMQLAHLRDLYANHDRLRASLANAKRRMQPGAVAPIARTPEPSTEYSTQGSTVEMPVDLAAPEVIEAGAMPEDAAGALVVKKEAPKARRAPKRTPVEGVAALSTPGRRNITDRLAERVAPMEPTPAAEVLPPPVVEVAPVPAAKSPRRVTRRPTPRTIPKATAPTVEAPLPIAPIVLRSPEEEYAKVIEASRKSGRGKARLEKQLASIRSKEVPYEPPKAIEPLHKPEEKYTPNKAIADENDWFREGEERPLPESMTENPEEYGKRTYTKSFRKFADDFGGPREFISLYNQAKAKTKLITFSIEDLRDAGPLSRWWYRRQIKAAAGEMLRQEEAERAAKKRRGGLQA